MHIESTRQVFKYTCIQVLLRGDKLFVTVGNTNRRGEHTSSEPNCVALHVVRDHLNVDGGRLRGGGEAGFLVAPTKCFRREISTTS